MSDNAKPEKSKGRQRQSRKGPVARPFPARSLEESLQIPTAIKEKNGGNPWPPTEVAKALGMGQSDKFYYLKASARDYGLTIGTRSTKTIELAPIGEEFFILGNPTNGIGYKKRFYF